MATAIYSSLIDHSPLDGTNDAINGAEVDANPYTLAQILDGTTATDLGQEGAVDFRFTSSRAGIRAIDLDNAGAAVHYGLVIEWDPGDGANLTDGSSGIGIQYIMPDDADTQTIYARHYVLMVNDAAAADAAEVVWETAVGGTLTVETLRYGASGLFWNDDGNAALDIRFETDNFANAFIMDAGLDVFAFGGAAVDDTFLGITPPARTSTATTNTYHMNIAAGGAVTIPAGTTTYVGSLNIEEPNITATGTVTNAFTVRIAGAPTEGGTTNYALWVDAGAVKFDGTLEVTGALTFTGALAVDDTTDTTSATTGSIQTDGGLGIVKALWVGTTSRLEGNVGIGGAPNDKLHIYGADGAVTGETWNGATQVAVENNGNLWVELMTPNTSYAVLAFSDPDASTRGAVIYDHGTALGWGADSLVFQTAGSQRVAIDSVGNLGFTVTPGAWLSTLDAIRLGGNSTLHALGATQASNYFVISQNAILATDGTYDYISTDEASRYYQQDGTHKFDVTASGTAGNDITWITGLQISVAGAIKNSVDSQGFYTGAGDDLRVWHNGTNSFLTNATGLLIVDNGLTIGTATTNSLIDDASNGAGSTTLYIGNASINVTSDRRAKYDIKDFAGSALDLLSHARVVSFNYDPLAIHDESTYGPSSRGRYIGMIAQEMREWAPWAINAGDGIERDDFLWQAEYEHVVPLLVAAVNELRGENTKMKARLN